MKKTDAVSMLEGLGFTVNILPDATAAGKVKTQLPAGGTYLNFGSAITIEIDAADTTDTTTTDTSATTTTSTTT
jgi:beta-lactam-binding protein with PASTA domain